MTDRDRAMPYSFKHRYQGRTRRVVLIDVPGFDSTEDDAADLFHTIVTSLIATHAYYKERRQRSRLHGIVYVHDVSGTKWRRSGQECLALLEALCGEQAKSNVCIVLSKCDTRKSAEVAWAKQELEKDKLIGYVGRIYEKNKDAKLCVKELWTLRPVIPEFLADVWDNNVALEDTPAVQHLMTAVVDPKADRRRAAVEKMRERQTSVWSEETRRRYEAIQQQKTRFRDFSQKSLKELADNIKWVATAAGSAGAGALPIFPHVGVAALGAAAGLGTVAALVGIAANSRE